MENLHIKDILHINCPICKNDIYLADVKGFINLTESDNRIQFEIDYELGGIENIILSFDTKSSKVNIQCESYMHYDGGICTIDDQYINIEFEMFCNKCYYARNIELSINKELNIVEKLFAPKEYAHFIINGIKYTIYNFYDIKRTVIFHIYDCIAEMPLISNNFNDFPKLIKRAQKLLNFA